MLKKSDRMVAMEGVEPYQQHGLAVLVALSGHSATQVTVSGLVDLRSPQSDVSVGSSEESPYIISTET